LKTTLIKFFPFLLIEDKTNNLSYIIDLNNLEKEEEQQQQENIEKFKSLFYLLNLGKKIENCEI